MILTGATKAQHPETLAMVLGRLEEAGLRHERKKCIYLADEVVYLGHRIDQHVLHPVQDKVEAIVKARSPENVQELQTLLGLLIYYGRFVNKLSTVLASLQKLLGKGQKRLCGPPQTVEFPKSDHVCQRKGWRTMIRISQYCCSAMNDELGALLSLIMEDGTERPVGFASRTLNAAERNYSQLGKEGATLQGKKGNGLVLCT